MKIKYSELRDANEVLIKLLNKEFPVKIAYKIAGRIKILSEIIDEIEKHRISLLKKYSISKENSVKEISQFNEEFSIYLEQEIEILCDLFSLKELENICLTPLDIIRLNKLIEKNKDF